MQKNRIRALQQEEPQPPVSRLQGATEPWAVPAEWRNVDDDGLGRAGADDLLSDFASSSSWGAQNLKRKIDGKPYSTISFGGEAPSRLENNNNPFGVGEPRPDEKVLYSSESGLPYTSIKFRARTGDSSTAAWDTSSFPESASSSKEITNSKSSPHHLGSLAGMENPFPIDQESIPAPEPFTKNTKDDTHTHSLNPFGSGQSLEDDSQNAHPSWDRSGAMGRLAESSNGVSSHLDTIKAQARAVELGADCAQAAKHHADGLPPNLYNDDSLKNLNLKVKDAGKVVGVIDPLRL